MVSLRPLIGLLLLSLQGIYAFPNLPLTVDGNEIFDRKGKPMKFAGTSWPGHNDLMIPEGLQYKSIKDIVSDIKSLGMNVVRLTYATEMIDDIFDDNQEETDKDFTMVLKDDNQDIDLYDTLKKVLSKRNATTVLANILRHNPQFTTETTRLEVFDAVVKELDAQEIYVHLDNHMSSAKWCCSGTDGNTWWGDDNFRIKRWLRGLDYMAQHGRRWPNLMSMSLRNAPRKPTNKPLVEQEYNWNNWYKYMRRGADLVNSVNPDPLIILPGLKSGTIITPIAKGELLQPTSDEYFNLGDFRGYGDKIAFGLHKYDSEVESCADLKWDLHKLGFQAMNPGDETLNELPVFMTEFGFDMRDDGHERVYGTCLSEWLPDHTAGWMQWVLAGSYYMRQDEEDFDEPWGLYNHDWSAWRNEAYVEDLLIPSINATLRSKKEESKD